MRTVSRFASLAILMGMLAVPVAEARTRIFVNIGPPPLVVEQPYAAPSVGYVWQPGYHYWSGNGYVWVHGAWARPPYRRSHWTSGRWAYERRGYYWMPGHWTRW